MFACRVHNAEPVYFLPLQGYGAACGVGTAQILPVGVMDNDQPARAEYRHAPVGRQAGSVDADNAAVQRHGGLRYGVVAQAVRRNRLIRRKAKKPRLTVNPPAQAAGDGFVPLRRAGERLVRRNIGIGGKTHGLHGGGGGAPDKLFNVVRAIDIHTLQHFDGAAYKSGGGYRQQPCAVQAAYHPARAGLRVPVLV